MALSVRRASNNKESKVGSGFGVTKTAVKQRKPAVKDAPETNSPGFENELAGLQIGALSKLTADSDFGRIFNLPENEALLGQYVRVYTFNQRASIAKTKTRGEVKGSGRKPWKQKHTGRARVGSIRNPVWRHGGVAHGPVPRDWSLNIPQKMRTLAFSTILSKKLRSGSVYQVDKVDVREGKTKEAVSMLKSWGLVGRTLTVLGESNERLAKACRNLKNMQVVEYKYLNAYQLLENTNIVFEKSVLDKLKEKYAKN